jgi:diketogulonate reductase-like aldo/keto reductase
MLLRVTRLLLAIDIIIVYGTEEELGIAIKETNVPREDLFITTKVIKNIADPEKALKESLKKLDLQYVDLYLIHSPFGIDIEKAWKSLEDLRDEGIPYLSLR